MKAIAESHLITVPLLDFDGFGGPFTARTLIQVATGHVESVKLDGVGHRVALEAPAALADAILRSTAASTLPCRRGDEGPPSRGWFIS